MNNHNHNNASNYDGIPVAPPYYINRDTEMTETQPKHRHQLKYNHAGKLMKQRSSPGKRVVYYHSLEPEINHIKKPLKRIGMQGLAFEKKIRQANIADQDFTQKLPSELCTFIVSLLDFDTLLVIPKVSRLWARLFYIDEIWKLKMAENNWKLKIPPNMYLSDEEQSWYYWFKQRYQLQHRWNVGKVASHYLLGHHDSVYCLQFDDEKIITGSRDRTIKIWNLNLYQCTDTLEGHQGSVLCLQYNDQVIISGSSDHTVIVWDMKTKRIRGRLHVNLNCITYMYTKCLYLFF